MPSATFFNSLSDDFERLTKSLGDGILAACLLGYDEATEENRKHLAANFADDDKLVEKIGTDDLNAQLRFDVKPTEAIDYFERKRIVTKPTFNKMEREAKAAAFYVSGVYREDVLRAFKFEIQDALENGQTQKHVTKQFRDILAGAGHRELGDWHLESAIRSNMMTAYGVGRRRAMEDSADLLPFWEYSAVGDDRTRPSHRALDGSIYPANHPFWDTHFPPWGFNCRCVPISRLDIPDGYDHHKPNPDTKIVFDADGLPAKAEYLTQVVDLKATKFVGVPKTSSLENALIEAAKAAKDAQLLNHQNIPQVVVDKAREIRRAKIEKIAGWDKNGDFLGQYEGNRDEVAYPQQIEDLLDGGFDVHNHPPDVIGNEKRFYEAPSDQDFQSAVGLNLKARYVVTRNYLYQVRAPKGGWTQTAIDDFYASYDKHRVAVANDLLNRTPPLTETEFDDLERHLIWKAVAKELKFKYKRWKVSEL